MIEKLSVIQSYNNYMGGIDTSDVMLYTYLDEKRTVKYWKRICFNIFSRMILNSYMLEKSSGAESKELVKLAWKKGGYILVAYAVRDARLTLESEKDSERYVQFARSVFVRASHNASVIFKILWCDVSYDVMFCYYTYISMIFKFIITK